ncbi:MAG TPA: glycosyltransferase [Chryseolinea sp.]
MTRRVLIAPLDWGLGHATRCIPLIRELLRRDCHVLIAGSGDSRLLLEKEFPQLTFLSLPGYHPSYPATRGMAWSMARQLSKFRRAIREEHACVERYAKEYALDLVISDNRYGCWTAAVPSIFITHQSNILMPKRFGWMAPWIRRINHGFIRKFTACWIPDFPGDHALAGDLISFGNHRANDNVRYIGPQSRFIPTHKTKAVYDMVCVFSGPEPQRTVFENIVVPQVKASGLKYFVVRGLPAAAEEQSNDNCVNFLSGSALQTVLEQASCVIARSGFSTVMDLSALQKRAIFVPTPGQTEQEYLAARLMKQGVAFMQEQHRFNLAVALEESKKYEGFTQSPADPALLAGALDNVFETLDKPQMQKERMDGK